MKSCDDMIESLFERRDAYLTAQKKKIKIKVGVVLTASFLCLCAMVGIGFSKKQDVDITQSPGNIIYEMNVISSFNTGGGSNFVSIPHNGQVLLSESLSSAVDTFGDSAVYRVVIDVYYNGELLAEDNDLTKNEMKRLLNEGYAIDTEENCYNNSHSGIVFFAKQNDLSEFKHNENYGYYLLLFDEGEEN